jgi:hypothetical protein
LVLGYAQTHKSEAAMECLEKTLNKFEAKA